jgi:hypothetical protein
VCFRSKRDTWYVFGVAQIYNLGYEAALFAKQYKTTFLRFDFGAQMVCSRRRPAFSEA